MSFLLSFITLISSYQVTWQNIDINVNLNDDISEYLNIPEAKLYIDGILVSSEATYTYDGVNRTFLSTIKTSYAKTYKLDYEVYYPLYDIKDTTSIYFHVIDNIPPEFIFVPSFEIDVGDKIPDLTALLSYKDNYDEVEDLVLNIEDHYIDTSKVGKYPVTYYVYDKSYNKAVATTYVLVVDRVAPTVSLEEPLKINYGQTFIDIDQYFKIKDNVDDEVLVEIDDSKVDYHQLGTYEVLLYATDLSNQCSVYTYSLEIIDNEAPKMWLSSAKPLNVFDEQKLNHLYDYILDISDNCDDLKVSDVNITHNIDIDSLGIYDIFFHVVDASGNETEMKLEVEVVDQTLPSINLKQELIFEVFSKTPFLITYFDIFDNYYAYSQLDIDIDEKIDFDVVGQYQVIVTVKDPSKNVSYYYDYVEVVDQTPVEITQLNDIIITNFEEVNYSSYFSFIDNYDDTVTNFIFDDSFIDYKTKGEYTLYVYAYDASLNETLYTSDIFVLDITPPTIEIASKQKIVYLGSEALDFVSYIIDAFDNYDDIGIKDVKITSDVNYQSIGIYPITYEIWDSSFNTTSVILELRVDDLKQPKVSMEDIIVTLNEPIDYLDNIEVEDDSSYRIYYDESHIDTTKVGTQYLTYVIQDQRGNYTTHIRKIVIKNNNSYLKFSDYIPLGLVFFAGISVLVIILVKYKKS
jgi:hypothetical protein